MEEMMEHQSTITAMPGQGINEEEAEARLGALAETVRAAERERCVKVIHRMAIDTAMTDEQSAALFDAERALRAQR